MNKDELNKLIASRKIPHGSQIEVIATYKSILILDTDEKEDFHKNFIEQIAFSISSDIESNDLSMIEINKVIEYSLCDKDGTCIGDPIII